MNEQNRVKGATLHVENVAMEFDSLSGAYASEEDARTAVMEKAEKWANTSFPDGQKEYTVVRASHEEGRWHVRVKAAVEKAQRYFPGTHATAEISSFLNGLKRNGAEIGGIETEADIPVDSFALSDQMDTASDEGEAADGRESPFAEVLRSLAPVSVRIPLQAELKCDETLTDDCFALRIKGISANAVDVNICVRNTGNTVVFPEVPVHKEGVTAFELSPVQDELPSGFTWGEETYIVMAPVRYVQEQHCLQYDPSEVTITNQEGRRAEELIFSVVDTGQGLLPEEPQTHEFLTEGCSSEEVQEKVTGAVRRNTSEIEETKAVKPETEKYAEESKTEKAEEAPQSVERQIEGSRTEESKIEEQQIEESRMEEPEIEEQQIEGSRTEESKIEEPKLDEPEESEPQMGRMDTDSREHPKIRAFRRAERRDEEPAAASYEGVPRRMGTYHKRCIACTSEGAQKCLLVLCAGATVLLLTVAVLAVRNKK